MVLYQLYEFLLDFRIVGNMKDVHLHSTENTTFREAHSLISTVKLAVVLYQLYDFLLDFRIVGNMKNVHVHSTENTTFR